MRTPFLFSLISLLATSGIAADVLSVGFDRDPLGDYSFATCKAAFPGITWQNGLTPDSIRVKVVEGGDTAWSGRSLRVFYPAGCLGPSGTGGAAPCGAQWRAPLSTMRDTLMSRYRVFFPQGFQWTKGGKLPGLCGSQCNTGGNPPSGTDGWSARIMWRAAGQLTMYLYYPGQNGTYGTDLVWRDSTGKTLAVETGRWHELVTRISLNTPGTNGGAGLSDGRVQAWFDGHLAVDSSGFRFRDRDSMHVNQFYFSTFFGGSTSDFSPASDNRIFFDDFLVGDSISPMRPSAVSPKLPKRPALHLGNRTLSWEGAPNTRLVVASLDGKVLLDRQFLSQNESLPFSRNGLLAWRLTHDGRSEGGIAMSP